MKRGLIFLILLIGCFACGTNNKPVSEAQKEKIVGEVKEVMSTIMKGAQEANFDMIAGTLLDSPDFVFLYNGNSFTYQQFSELGKALIGSFINQKGTITDEKYLVLNSSNVLYTANSNWLVNFKDGHAVLEDPWAMQYLFKKVDNTWKVISINESGYEQTAKNTEMPNTLNQLELIKKFLGTWQFIQNKDTAILADFKQYGNGIVETDYLVVKGKKSFESIWSYSFSEKDNLFKAFALSANGSYTTWIGSFVSENKWQQARVQNFSPSNVYQKVELLLETPKTMKVTYINGENVRTEENRLIKIK